MPKVFVCYRREGGIDIAGRMYDRLAAHFGADSVFMDVDSIPLGVDYRTYLGDWVGRCHALLAVVSEGWLDARYQDGPMAGERRLGDPSDFVTIEIAAALKRGVPVVPVLVGRASMPGEDDLPDELSDFAYRNAAEVRSGRDFHPHMDRLIRSLEEDLASREDSREKAELPPRPERFIYVPVEPPAVVKPTNLGFDDASPEGRPAGWFDSLGFVGGASTQYGIGVVPRDDKASGRCVRLSRQGAHETEFGSLMQRCPAQSLVGRHLCLEAELSTRDVGRWAGAWLRVDGRSSHLFFDNMSQRPIRGSTPWTRYTIEADIPEGSQWLNYGILLVGDGTVWADNFELVIQDAAA